MARQTKTFTYNGRACTAQREVVYAQGRRNDEVTQWVARFEDGSPVRGTDQSIWSQTGQLDEAFLRTWIELQEFFEID